MTTPIINVPIPVVSASFITKKQESHASSQHATIIINIPDTDSDSSLSNDSTSSSVVEYLGEATSGQISEGRHLVLPLTPIEIEQKKIDKVQKSRFTLDFDDPPLSDTPRIVGLDPNVNYLEDFFDSELSKTPRDSAMAAFAQREYIRATSRPVSNANEPKDLPVFTTDDEEMFAVYPLPDIDNTFIPVDKLTYRPTPEEFMVSSRIFSVIIILFENVQK